MKKRIYLFVIAVVCAVACLLGACGGETSAYDSLNQMLDASYSQITLTVTETFDENTSLQSVYVFSYSGNDVTIAYSVEQFAELSLDGPLASSKTTLTGEVVIKSGLLVSVNGDDVGLTGESAETGLTFKEEYFANADLTGLYLRADVSDASGFFGTPLTCTDMKVEATFLDFFYDITITYTSASGNAVEYRYEFTK